MVPAPRRKSLAAQVRRALTLSLALVLLAAALFVAATAGKSALRTVYFASSKAGDAFNREGQLPVFLQDEEALAAERRLAPFPYKYPSPPRGGHVQH